MLQARLGKLLGLQHEEELVLLSPDEQRLWQAALHPDAHPEGGLACNDDALLANQRECILAWIKEVGRQILSGARFNLVNVSFPVRMFEPRSFLQKIADSWVNLELLDRAAEAGERGDPLGRMKLVVAWFVAGLSAGVVWRKPFNPILGETWEAEMDMDAGREEGVFGGGGAAGASGAGEQQQQQHQQRPPQPPRRRVARLFAEQVSHHPPIAAYVVEGADGGWRFEGHVQPAVEVVVRWYGIRTASRGARRVSFSDGSSIEMFMPAFGVKGVVYSKRPRAEVVGTARLVDARNRLEAVLRFGPAVGAAAGHAGSGGAGARLATLARADAVVGEIYRLRGDAPVAGPSRSGALRMTPSTIGPLEALGTAAPGGGAAAAGGGAAARSGGGDGAAAAAAAAATGGGPVTAGTDRPDVSYCDDDDDSGSHASFSSCQSASDEGQEHEAASRGGGGGGTAVAVAAGSAATAAAAAAAAANNGGDRKHHHHHHHHHHRKPAPAPADPRDEAIYAAVAARLDTLAVDGPPPLLMVASGQASPVRPGGGGAGSPVAPSRMLHRVASEPLRYPGSAASSTGHDTAATAAAALAAAAGGAGAGAGEGSDGLNGVSSGGGGTGGGAGAGATSSGGCRSGKTKLAATAAANSLRLAASRLGRLGKSGSKDKKIAAAAAAAVAAAVPAAAAAPEEGPPAEAAEAAAAAAPPAPPTASPPSLSVPPLPPAVPYAAGAGQLSYDAAAASAGAGARAAPSPPPPPAPAAPPLAPAHSSSFFRGSGGHADAPSVPGVAVARIEGSWLSHINIDHRRYWTLMDPASPYAPAGVAAEKSSAAANGGVAPPPRAAPRWLPVERPLPSDCRLREDLAFLAAGDEAESQRWKEVLERRQRHDKKLREEAGGGH